jgi:hypothetical protein
MASNIDYNALGQAIDTTWGKTSTPKTASYSVKFTLSAALESGTKGEDGSPILTASYAAIVNFGTEKEMALMKQMYESESIEVINAALKNVKAIYSKLSGKTLKSKEHTTSDSLEIIGFAIHNPKRTAYYRRKTAFELA